MATTKKPVAAEPRSKKTAKLSYNQQRLLEILPQKVEELEQKIALTEQKLGDADLYNSNRAEFEKLSADLIRLKDEMEKAENEWLEIQALKEELEA